MIEPLSLFFRQLNHLLCAIGKLLKHKNLNEWGGRILFCIYDIYDNDATFRKRRGRRFVAFFFVIKIFLERGFSKGKHYLILLDRYSDVICF